MRKVKLGAIVATVCVAWSGNSVAAKTLVDFSILAFGSPSITRVTTEDGTETTDPSEISSFISEGFTGGLDQLGLFGGSLGTALETSLEDEVNAGAEWSADISSSSFTLIDNSLTGHVSLITPGAAAYGFNNTSDQDLIVDLTLNGRYSVEYVSRIPNANLGGPVFSSSEVNPKGKVSVLFVPSLLDDSEGVLEKVSFGEEFNVSGIGSFSTLVDFSATRDVRIPAGRALFLEYLTSLDYRIDISTAPTVIPIPATLPMSLFGLAVFGGLRLRRKLL